MITHAIRPDEWGTQGVGLDAMYVPAAWFGLSQCARHIADICNGVDPGVSLRAGNADCLGMEIRSSFARRCDNSG